MARAVLCKKEFLRSVKPGSITHYEPKFIWVKMLEIPTYINQSSLAKKFNKMLEQTLAQKDAHYIIDINEIMFEANYFSSGSLNGAGRIRYWREIDNQIELFDYHRVSLKPGHSTERDSSPDSQTADRNRVNIREDIDKEKSSQVNHNRQRPFRYSRGNWRRHPRRGGRGHNRSHIFHTKSKCEFYY